VPRFPLYTDADVCGPYIDALKRTGWDIMRAIDEYAEGTDDEIHFERAIREGRVLVSNDIDQLVAALKRIREGRPFPGLVNWRKRDERRISAGSVLRAFEDLAAKDGPFAPYPIVFLKPKA
jgi:hypothetical protein